MLSRFLARKKMDLQVFMIIRDPIHHGCGRSSLMHSGTAESAYHQLSQSSGNQIPTLTFGFSLASIVSFQPRLLQVRLPLKA